MLQRKVKRALTSIPIASHPPHVKGRTRAHRPRSARAVLRDHLIAHKLATGGQGIVFTCSGPEQPFSSVASQKRADKAWRTAGLGWLSASRVPSFLASFMIDAGINPKALQTFMGHSSITVTLDLYGHLMPGGEAEAAAMADIYLKAREDRSAERARAAEPTGANLAHRWRRLPRNRLAKRLLRNGRR